LSSSPGKYNAEDSVKSYYKETEIIRHYSHLRNVKPTLESSPKGSACNFIRNASSIFSSPKASATSIIVMDASEQDIPVNF